MAALCPALARPRWQRPLTRCGSTDPQARWRQGAGERSGGRSPFPGLGEDGGGKIPQWRPQPCFSSGLMPCEGQGLPKLGLEDTWPECCSEGRSSASAAQNHSFCG